MITDIHRHHSLINKKSLGIKQNANVNPHLRFWGICRRVSARTHHTMVNQSVVTSHAPDSLSRVGIISGRITFWLISPVVLPQTR